jgi:hypothetical protein
MTPGASVPSYLAEVHDRLAAGELEAALDRARHFLGQELPESADARDLAAARYAAALLIGAVERRSLAEILDSFSHTIPPSARQSVPTILELTRLLEAAQAGGLLDRVIEPVGNEAVSLYEATGTRLATAATGYGFGQPVTGDVWFDGFGLTRLAMRLGLLFRVVGNTRNEARLAMVRARLTTHILPHYDYEVIPAMNAAADALVRLGSPDGSRFYEAVLSDYATLPDEQDGPVADVNVRLALEALADTCRGYPGAVEQDGYDCPAILARIEEVLARPVPEPADEEKAEEAGQA